MAGADEGAEGAAQSGSLTPNYFNVVNPAPRSYQCATCGGSFPASDLLDQHGTIICNNCYAAAAAHADDAAFPSAHPMPPVSQEHAVSEADHALHADEVVHDEPAHDDLASFSATPAPSAPVSYGSGARPQPRNDFLPLLVGGAFGIIVLAAVIIYVSTGNSPPQQQANSNTTLSNSTIPAMPTPASSEPTAWERQYTPHLERLRSQAKALEASGDKAGALTRYQDMLNLAGSAGAKVNSDAMLAELADARSRWEVLVKQVKPTETVPPPPKVNETVASAGPDTPVKPTVSPTPPDGTPSVKPSPDPTTGPSTVAENQTTPSENSTPKPTPAPVEDEANWEANHRTELAQLLSEGAEAAKGTDKVLALTKFEQALRLVQGHEKRITDADLKQKLAGIPEQRKQLLAAVRDSDETRMATVRSLLAAGLKSLRDGKWKTAQETLVDARHVTEKMPKAADPFHNPEYLSTLHALAVAYLENKNVQRAGEMFDEGAPLGRAAVSRPTREMVWNRAVTDVTQKFNIMRTVKMLKDYLEKHPDPPDEDLINLFGTALNTADETNPTNRKLLDDAIGYYGILNTQLEKTKPGQKRWGAQWLSEADAQSKYEDQAKYIEVYQQKLREKELAGVKVKEAQENAAGIRRPPGAEAQLTAAKNALQAADRTAQAARAAIPRAAWLTDLKPKIPPETSVASIATPPVTTVAPPPGPSSGSSTLPPDNPSAQDPKPGPTPAPTPAPPATPPPPIVPTREVRFAAAFPVDKTHLVTAADPIGNAREVRIEDTQGNVLSARVTAREGKLALLEISPGDLPGGALRYFNLSIAFTGGSPVRCVAIPEANVFGPAALFLNGESVPAPKTAKWTVGLSEHPRLAGSPLIDSENAIVGVVVADREDPKTRLPAVPVKELIDFLQAQHITPSLNASVDPLGIYQVAAESE